MNEADARTFGTAVAIAGLAVLIWLAAAAWIAIDEHAMRAEAAQHSVSVAAWQISQVLENVRHITEEAAARQARGELAP